MRAPIENFVSKDYPSGSITQWFGENHHLYNDPRHKVRMDGHNGIDIVAPWRTPLLAVETGIIVDVKRAEDGYGRHIRLLGDEKHGIYQYQWVYGHCEDIFVEVGDRVEAGQIIGRMGNTGFVISGNTPFWNYNPYAGTHLHLGRRRVQVVSTGSKYPGSDIGMKYKDYDNGYYGYEDFRLDLEKASSDTSYRAKQLTIISLLNYMKKLLTV